MFEGAKWKSKSHSVFISLAIALPTVAAMLAGFFLVQYGYTVAGAVVIGAAVSGAAIALGVFNKNLKWYNPKLIFALDGFGVKFGMRGNDSFFYEVYENISGYSVKQHKNGYADITVYFTAPADAGSFGRIKYLKMIRVENGSKAAEILNGHSVPRIENKMKVNKDNSI